MYFSLHTFLLGVRNIHIRRLFLLVWRSLSRSGPRVLFVPLTVGRKPAAKDCPIICPYIPSQGCGLGLKVSISRQSRDLTTPRLSLVSDKVLNISVSDQYVSGLVSVLAQNVSASCLGLGLFHVVGRDVLWGVRAVWCSIVVIVPYRPICLSLTNSCLFDSSRCTYSLFRLLTYHEGKLADVHSPPAHPTKVAAKKNIITNHYNASNMLQLFLFLRNLLWMNMLHLVTDPFPIWTSFQRF